MKKREFMSEIDRMSWDELEDKARSLAEEHMKLRFRKASTGQLDQPHVLGEVKRNLARVKSVMTKKRKALASADSQ